MDLCYIQSALMCVVKNKNVKLSFIILEPTSVPKQFQSLKKNLLQRPVLKRIYSTIVLEQFKITRGVHQYLSSTIVIERYNSTGAVQQYSSSTIVLEQYNSTRAVQQYSRSTIVFEQYNSTRAVQQFSSSTIVLESQNSKVQQNSNQLTLRLQISKIRYQLNY